MRCIWKWSQWFITSRWTAHCICVTSTYGCLKKIFRHQKGTVSSGVGHWEASSLHFGHHFSVHTDHSPLVNLFEKCLNDTSPHLQHLLLCLSQYQINIQYVTHKCVPTADCMSQFIDHKTGKEDPSLNLQIANVTRANINWNQIKVACLDDPTMIELAYTIQRGWPETARNCLRTSNHTFHTDTFCVLWIELSSCMTELWFQRVLGKLSCRKYMMCTWELWNPDCLDIPLCTGQIGTMMLKLHARHATYVGKINPCLQTSQNSSSKPIILEKSMVLMSQIYRESLILFWSTITHAVYFFKWHLKSLHSADVIEALKSIFYDVGVPDKLISDNTSYFVSEEFKDFMMKWAILHITSSPHFPHGNAHAEKAVHVVKQIYLKVSDIKLALLMLKTMPIANNEKMIQDAPGNLSFGCQLKAHLPFRCYKQNTCNFDNSATSEVPSKYGDGQDVSVKLDNNTKWMPGKILDVLPNQSYKIKLVNGHIFRRNEHHVTIRQQGAKWPEIPQVSSPQRQPQWQPMPGQPYNLRSRKNHQPN